MRLMNRIRSALLYTSVIRPLRVGKRLLPDRLWRPLEVASRSAGALAGRVARPFVLTGSSPQDRLRALLRFTELAEESLGIRGTNEILDECSARRTIQHCPFADRIRDLPEFCSSVGGCAGEGAFAAIVAGAEFRVLRTKSRGDAECEYEYRVPREGA